MTPKKTPFPGSEPVTAREIQAANRRLIAAMKRHKDAKKRLALADRDLREAKARVKGLVDLVARGGPQPVPSTVCPDCQAPVGQGATCLTCSAIRSEFSPVQFDGAGV